MALSKTALDNVASSKVGLEQGQPRARLALSEILLPENASLESTLLEASQDQSRKPSTQGDVALEATSLEMSSLALNEVGLKQKVGLKRGRPQAK